jgi:uncharacterized membrane protein YfcA
LITDPLFYLMAVPAVILQGLSKGGFAGLNLLSLPLLALVISPLDGAAIMLPILMVQDVVTVYSYRRSFNGRAASILIAGALFGIGLAAVVASNVSTAVVELVMGTISVGFVLDAFLRKKMTGGEPRKAAVPQGAFWGACAGFTSFITNTGAPPVQVYLLPLRLRSDVYVGTMAIFFGAINLVKFFAFFMIGRLTPGKLVTSSLLFPLAIVATLFGVWLVRKIKAEKFYKVIYSLVLIIGAYLAGRGLYTILT